MTNWAQIFTGLWFYAFKWEYWSLTITKCVQCILTWKGVDNNKPSAGSSSAENKLNDAFCIFAFLSKESSKIYKQLSHWDQNYKPGL